MTLFKVRLQRTFQSNLNVFCLKTNNMESKIITLECKDFFFDAVSQPPKL